MVHHQAKALACACHAVDTQSPAADDVMYLEKAAVCRSESESGNIFDSSRAVECRSIPPSRYMTAKTPPT